MTTTLEDLRDLQRRDTGTIISTTIASGQSLSAAIDLGDRLISHIQMPTGWTAAVMTFQVSSDGLTYQDFWNEDAEITLQAAANRAIGVSHPGWAPVRYLKIRSGTSAAPVAQAADRAINIFTGYRA
ncbi:hypothetical protein ACWAT4_24070 [Bradyrhizobium manausense]